MEVNRDIWHVSQKWSHWNRIKLTVDGDNFQTLMDNETLLQPRFSSSLLVSANVNSFMSLDDRDNFLSHSHE